jgi:16S rRNA (uracil1498-N3)-methyltransferase
MEWKSSMRRFFFDPKSRSGDTVLLSEEESRHIVRVLRLAVGSEIELLDGRGTAYRAVIAAIDRRVAARLGSVVATDLGGGRTVRVVQGILKGEKMDTIVQKCTELGVTRLSPVESSRCQGKADPAQNRKRHERWQRIGLASCKQCLRLQPMQVDGPVPLAGAVEEEAGSEILRLLFWEEEKAVHLRDIAELAAAPAVTLLLGPEGGFTREEVELARAHGWRTVSLGERILRAETATLAAVAIVQHATGNL